MIFTQISVLQRQTSAVKTAFENVDIVIFRENTEDLYAGVEEMIDQDTVHSIKIITRKCCERIIALPSTMQ